MTEPVINQFTVLLYTIFTGVLAGFLFDIYAALGQVLRLDKAGVLVGDAIFWLVLTPVVYCLLLYYNQGEVRFFVFLGLGAGAALYFYVSRGRVRALVAGFVLLVIKLVRFARKIAARLAAILLFPFRLFYMILSFPFRLPGLALRKAAQKISAPARRLAPRPLKKLCNRLTGGWKRFIAKIKPG